MEGLGLEFLASSIRIATPLLFAALGGVLSERAGVFAVGLESMMLGGAAAGCFAAFWTGSALLGVLAGAAAGALFAAIVAFATIRAHADHIVTGLVVNILALGITSFALTVVAARVPAMRVGVLPPVPGPLLSDLPFLGPLLFQQPALTYLALVIVPAMYLVLMHTRAGLALRAVGENPEAAFALGSDPDRIRMLAVVVGGVLAGIGGCVLTLQQVGTFLDNATAGRGYIALAAVIAARWSPLAVVATCLLFGAAEALQYRVQSWQLPVSSYVVQMTPYVVSLGILAAFGRASQLPAGLGRHFRRS